MVSRLRSFWRPICAVLVLGVLISSPAPAKTRLLPAPAAKVQREGKLAFVNTAVDFSKVPQGSEPTYSFTFTNSGTGPLHIRSIHSACGCTIVTMPEKQTFMPEEGGTIQVALKTGQFIGTISKDIIVITNEATAPLHRLTLSAEVDPTYLVDQPVVDYGEIAQGELQEKIVTFTGTDAAIPYQILGVDFDSSRLDVTYRELEPKRWQVSVRLITGNRVGAISEKIRVRSNNPYKPDMMLYVTATVRNPLHLEPRYLDFGTLAKETSRQRTLLLTGPNDFTVGLEQTSIQLNGEELSPKDAYIEMSSEQVPRQKHELGLTLHRNVAAPGTVHGKLTLHTSEGFREHVDFYGVFR